MKKPEVTADLRELRGHHVPSPSPGPTQPPVLVPRSPQPGSLALPPALHTQEHHSWEQQTCAPALPQPTVLPPTPPCPPPALGLCWPCCLVLCCHVPALLCGCALRRCHTGSYSVLGPGRSRRGGKSCGSRALSGAVAHRDRGLRAGKPWFPCTAQHRQERDDLPSWGHLALLDFVKRSSRNRSDAAAWGHGTPKSHTDPPPQNPTGQCCPWSQYCQLSGL